MRGREGERDRVTEREKGGGREGETEKRGREGWRERERALCSNNIC